MTNFDRTMSPDDHMVTADLESYFRTAQSGLDCVLKGVAAAGKAPEEIKSVLDFGSGYGRVYRALAAGFPEAELTACDLMGPAAEFCASTFGGDWVESAENLDDTQLPRLYDLVWLGSVFTHLPAHRWAMLLDFLARFVESDGTVVFTTHGTRAVTHIQDVLLVRNPYAVDADRFELMVANIDRLGFDFIPNKPAATKYQADMGMEVTQNEYGFSFARDWWIAELITRSPEWELVEYFAPGWAGNHDSAVLRRR